MKRSRLPIVFLNGRYLRADRAQVSALDRGLLYGDGVFETIRADDANLVELEAHLARLRRTARRIDLPLPGRTFDWRACIGTLLRRNRLDRATAAVRITVTRGSGAESLVPIRGTRPTVLITARRVDPAIARLRRDGARVILLPFHPGLGGFLAGSKTLDYVTAMIGKKAARRRAAFEGIYTTPGGEILEGTTSNVFVVRSGFLQTPPARAGVLPGITRARVLALARREHLVAREAPLARPELLAASEVFLTATTFGVVPVVAIDGGRIAGGVGPITRRLQEALAGGGSDRN